jgi:hypothetical protein
MSVLFNHARRYDLYDRKAISKRRLRKKQFVMRSLEFCTVQCLFNLPGLAGSSDLRWREP